MLASASASQHDSEAPSDFDFDDSPPPSQASLPPFGSQPFESDYDLFLPAPLDSGATATSALPLLAGPSSLKMPTTEANKASGIKRKQDSEVVDSASQAEHNSIERKRPKRESLDDGASSFMAPGHMSDVAGPDSTVDVCAVPLTALFADFRSRNLVCQGHSVLTMSQPIRRSIRSNRHHPSQMPHHLSHKSL